MTRPKRRADPKKKAEVKGPGHLWSAASRARACEAIYERIKTGTPMKVAAALEGVPPRTWEDWREKDMAVRDASDLAMMIGSEVQREKLEIEMDAGGQAQEVKVRLHYMGILYRDVYAPVDKREISGPDGAPIRVASPEMVERVRQAVAAIDEGSE